MFSSSLFYLKVMFEELKKRFKDFDINKAIDMSFNNLEEEMIDLQQEQMLTGIDSKGRNVDTYSPFTESINQGRLFQGKQKTTDTSMFFYDSGNFYEKMYVEKVSGGRQIWSRGEHTDSIITEHADEDIFGYNQTTLAKFIEQFRAELQYNTRKLIGL